MDLIDGKLLSCVTFDDKELIPGFQCMPNELPNNWSKCQNVIEAKGNCNLNHYYSSVFQVDGAFIIV